VPPIVPASPKTCQRTAPGRVWWSDAAWDGRRHARPQPPRAVGWLRRLSCPVSDQFPNRASRWREHDDHRRHPHQLRARPCAHPLGGDGSWSDAGPQAKRRCRAGGREQDRPCRGPVGRRPRRCRSAAYRDQDDQRPLRRGDHGRAGPALDPDRGGDDRRGTAVLSTRRPAAGRIHRQGGPQPGRRLVLPSHRPRPRRGADRGRDGEVRQGQRPQARLRRRRRRRPAVRVLRPAHRLRPLPAAPPHQPPRDRDPAVFPAPGRLRPVPYPR
jgi:hypothetical protein